MSETWRNRLATASLILSCVSLLSWLVDNFAELPDGGEFLITLAFYVGISAAIPVTIAVVASRRTRVASSLLVKIAAWVALVCVLWNAGFWVLFLIAYCCRPSGLC